MYVKHQFIRDINLGGLAAEHDNFLEQYFYESDLFRRVALGYTRILIGNRGSGKSAIFMPDCEMFLRHFDWVGRDGHGKRWKSGGWRWSKEKNVVPMLRHGWMKPAHPRN